jgi:hypothetical protein
MSGAVCELPAENVEIPRKTWEWGRKMPEKNSALSDPLSTMK